MAGWCPYFRTRPCCERSCLARSVLEAPFHLKNCCHLCRYRMPMALLGMLASLVVWESVRYCRERWGLATRAPGVGQALLHCAQIATAILLYVCNLQFTLVYAIGLSYTVMMLHASLRKLTPSSLSDPVNKDRRAQPRRS